jgi:V8-like Glu-specific endopeptidase
LHFGDYNLGMKSYVTFTSLKDGGLQRLDSRTAPQWGNTSAYLNGDAVLVELHVAPGESGIYIRVDELIVGESLDAIEGDKEFLKDRGIESICGTTDDRTLSSFARSGRLTYLNVFGNPTDACSTWLASNGALLTAGHCVDFDPDMGGPLLPDGVLDLDNNDIVEFSVPASTATGTLQLADPDDQYAIDLNSVTWNFDGSGQGFGRDWAVFAVFPNPNTDLMPHVAQNTFHRMTNGNPTAGSSTIRITGYGTDSTPLTRNQVQQTHTGTYIGESSIGADFWHRYRVDTTGGNSGSPIFWQNNFFTVGIHTNAGCTSTGGDNAGTSFEHNPLENALENFPGANTVFVDKVRFGATENGTVFHPYDTVTEAVTSAVSGGRISIVRSSYNETMTINKAVTLEAPVGTVIIGE